MRALPPGNCGGQQRLTGTWFYGAGTIATSINQQPRSALSGASLPVLVSSRALTRALRGPPKVIRVGSLGETRVQIAFFYDAAGRSSRRHGVQFGVRSRGNVAFSFGGPGGRRSTGAWRPGRQRLTRRVKESSEPHIWLGSQRPCVGCCADGDALHGVDERGRKQAANGLGCAVLPAPALDVAWAFDQIKPWT